MSTFKEWMERDISAVFVDVEEHGDMATINGVEVPVVWDGDTLNYRIRANYQGLILGDALFYISAKEWEKVPRVSHPPRTDEAILIDGRARPEGSARCPGGCRRAGRAYPPSRSKSART